MQQLLSQRRMTYAPGTKSDSHTLYSMDMNDPDRWGAKNINTASGSQSMNMLENLPGGAIGLPQSDSYHFGFGKRSHEGRERIHPQQKTKEGSAAQQT